MLAAGLNYSRRTGPRLIRTIPSGLLPIFLTGLMAGPAGARAQALPPLPQLALDTYPPSARQAISLAHKEATARPADPAAVAALAKTLQAWEQWEAAHQAYARCQALAPRNF